MIKKSVLILSIIIYFGVILTTSSPLQHNNVFDNNSSFPLKNNIQFIYAEGDDGGGDKNGGDKKDNGDDNDKKDNGDDNDKKDNGDDNDKKDNGDDNDKKDNGDDNDKKDNGDDNDKKDNGDDNDKKDNGDDNDKKDNGDDNDKKDNGDDNDKKDNDKRWRKVMEQTLLILEVLVMIGRMTRQKIMVIMIKRKKTNMMEQKLLTKVVRMMMPQ